MTDLPQINPSYSPNNSWWNSLFGSKPVSGGFTPNEQNIEAQAGGSANAPTAMSSTNSNSNSNGTNAPQSASTAAQNSTVGNTQNSNTATTNGILASNNASLLNPQGNASPVVTNGVATGGTASAPGQTTGLPSSLFSSAVSGLRSLTGGEGGIAGQLGNFGSALKTGINDVGASWFGTGGGTAGYVNAAGDSVAQGSAGATAVTASQDASLASSGGNLASVGGGTQSLTGYLGGAGIGYGIGSIYGSLTGLQGTKVIGADVGGAIGGAAGSTFGPLGTVAGSVLGSAVGGLFGNSTPATAASNTGFNLTPTGAEGIQDGGGSKGMSQDVSNTLGKQFSTLTQSASSALGINFNTNLEVQTGYNSLYSYGGPSQPGYITVGPTGSNDFKAYSYNPSDSNSVTTAYFGAIADLANQSGYTDMTSLQNWFYGTGPSTSAPGTSQAFNDTMSGNNVTIAPKA